MTSILALFVTMAMLLSGAGYSADPAAASSRVITIEDIVFTFDGTEYPLAPTSRMGAATEGETSLFDFAVPTCDSDLYAFQAQIDCTRIGANWDDFESQALEDAEVCFFVCFV